MRKCPKCGSTLVEKANTGDQVLEGIAKIGGIALGVLFHHQDLAKSLCGGPLSSSKYRCKGCMHVFED